MKRSLALFLAATLTVGSTVTVFAEDEVAVTTEETTETAETQMSVSDAVDAVGTDNEINTEDYERDYSLNLGVTEIHLADFDPDRDAVKTDGDEFHNNEAAKVEAASESVQAMEENVAKAQEAAQKANAELDKVEKALDDIDTAEANAEAAKDAAADVVKEGSDLLKAEDAIETTITDATKNTESAENTASAYNTQEAKDQSKVDSITVSVPDQQAAADNAESKLAEAKDEFEKALAIDSTEMTEEIADHLDKAIKACSDVSGTYYNANYKYNVAQNSYNIAVTEYNIYAYAYGEPLYGQKEVTYDPEDTDAVLKEIDSLAAKLETYKNEYDKKHSDANKEYADNLKKDAASQLNNAEKFDDFVKEVNDASLADQKVAIEAAKEDLQDARENYNAAKESATEAQEVLTAAVAELDKQAGIAEEASNEVKDYYVTSAKEALKATEDSIPAKETEVADAKAKLDAATSKAEAAGGENYNKTLASKKKDMDDAQAEVDKIQAKIDGLGKLDPRRVVYGIEKISAEKNLNKKKDAYNSYNTPSAKAEEIENAKKNSSEYVSAKNDFDTKNSELTALNDTKAAQENELAKAIQTRDAYLTEAGNQYSQEFVDAVIAKLNETSDAENQLDYEKALNDWVNDTFNTWHLLSKTSIRMDLNKTFIDSFWERFGNTLGGTQWIVSTATVDKAVAEKKADYDAIIEDYIEKLCTAEANWADVSAQAAKNSKDNDYDAVAVANIINTIDSYNTTVESAEAKLEEVEDEYDEAVTTLAELQNRVNALKLNGINLTSLQEKLAKAEAELKTVEKEVEKARAAKASADNLQNLAKKLRNPQTTGFYAQLTKDGDFAVTNGYEFDQQDGVVVSQNTKYFSSSLGVQEIPYSMLRDYAEYVYKNLDSVEKSGHGIALNENSHSEEVLYWELTEDGKGLTGNKYTFEELQTLNPETGKKYFLGYVLKYEGGDSTNKYHIDGFIYDYEHIDIPVPPTEPTGPSEEPQGNDIPEVGDVVTIEESPVALADTIEVAAEPAAAPVNAVLGARRAGGADEGSVLGAKRGLDRAVLGKRRSPKTNDSFALYIWMMFLAIFTGSAIVCTKSLNKIDKDI